MTSVATLPLKGAFRPDYAIPPGATLKDTIEAMGMTQKELSTRMSRPEKTISDIINGQTAITPETAGQLEYVLGVPAEFWLNLEANYQATKTRIEFDKQLDTQKEIAGKFPYADMAALDWVKPRRDKAERVNELRRYFGVTSLDTVEELEPAAFFRKSPSSNESSHALAAWLRKGELMAQEIQTAPYEANGFRKVIEEAMRGIAYHPSADWATRLQTMCADKGVAVVYVPHLKGTKVNGASRWITSEKALIQLSIRGVYADIFWFSFFHEAAHILLHGKKQVFIDYKDTDSSTVEKEANSFARDALVPPSHYRELVKLTPFSKDKILHFSSKTKISAGVLVGRLQHDGLLPHAHLNDLRPKLSWGN